MEMTSKQVRWPRFTAGVLLVSMIIIALILPTTVDDRGRYHAQKEGYFRAMGLSGAIGIDRPCGPYFSSCN